ncbi:hypothetical protein M378DRAFT_165469 [Amanita muscaria Koide BX008]|uniref:Cytochrome P450 n=1 Tax=Amanita muscaria (strain Koide BX008) TaxID=946122 RepID=A0A0C2T7Q5_AMAMK|nr:hypothetical protein M378DRAFT_165469 [Amanita muscaria Koide BX008]
MTSVLSLGLLIALPLVLTKLTKDFIDRRNSPLAELRGPPRKTLFSGRRRDPFSSDNIQVRTAKWAEEYGSVYKTTTALGWTIVVLCDPKAIAHFHAKDGTTYARLPFLNTLTEAMMGPNMLSADKEQHQRLRRSVAPAFSNAALRGLTSVFYDSVYKVKANWDALLQSSNDSDGVILDVQDWFDSVGIAGFGHDFRSLDGEQSPVLEVFTLFSNILESATFILFVLTGFYFPQVVKAPVKPARLLKKLKEATSDIAKQLLENSNKEEGASDTTMDRSIIGVLLRAQSGKAKLSHDELLGQGSFLFAGYETTSSKCMVQYMYPVALISTYAVVLSWALVELARHADIQKRLREESHQDSGSEPSWDQLMSSFPYLDAVVHETLRLHPPAEEMMRVADEDDTIPPSQPLKLASGKTVDSVFIPKGTVLNSPFLYINCCEAFWGPDPEQFVPERWLTDNPYPPKELVGHRQLYTFSDGPRMCLGKGFALAELKVALLVLVRNFTFELPDGPDTEIQVHRLSILPRPKVAGEVGCSLPMKIKPVAN